LPKHQINLLLLLVHFFSGCGLTHPIEGRALHVWGHTRRGEIPTGRDRLCRTDWTSSPDAQRLKTIAARIVSANDQTFSGPLDLEKICLGVDPQLTTMDARTTPELLRVVFSPQLIAVAQTDGELAAVLSHELAHISLQHAGFGELPPLMNKDSEFLNLNAEAKAIQEEIVALALAKAEPTRIFVLSEKYAQIYKKMNQRIDAVYGESHAHLNWIEQEADEVGAEFFRRAGFDLEEFISILWSSHPSDVADRTECEALVVEAQKSRYSARRPSRGNRFHPTTCWRVFHLKVDEAEQHGY